MATTFKHGIYVDETKTKMPTPTYATSGIQVVFGTAPVNLADDPYSVTNKPILIETMDDAENKLGYSTDFTSYTLCQSMFASFEVQHVSPIIMINVLDPKTHTQAIASETLDVTNKMASFKHTGVLLDTLKVSTSTGAALTADTDYVATFADDGTVAIGVTSTGKAASEKQLKVEGTAIDPSKVKAADVVGGISGDGAVTGISTLKEVYPQTQCIPATLLAPGYAAEPTVMTALINTTKKINGIFRAFALVDIDSSKATKYTGVAAEKTANAYTSADCVPLWPEVLCEGSTVRQIAYSAALGAGIQALDAENDDVPCRTPSNVDIGIVGAVLHDGTEVNLDIEQANELNADGIMTVLRAQGWKTWGTHTGAFPDATDPKDSFIGIRRMFDWQANSFITRYFDRLDQNISHRTIQALVNDENIRCNALQAADKWAGGKITFNDAENPMTSILNGKVVFHQAITPYPPMQEIDNTLEYSTDMLKVALAGGEK